MKTELELVAEYIHKYKEIKRGDHWLIEPEACLYAHCSPETLRRWAKKMRIPVFGKSFKVRMYNVSDLDKIKLRRRYNKAIKRFGRLFDAGFYEKR